MSVEVYGASDDLIEVEGDIDEEFSALNDGHEPVYLAFSNGIIINIVYSRSGVWRITPVVGNQMKIVQAPEGDEDNYSDVATIEGDITWVVKGDSWAGVKKAVRA